MATQLTNALTKSEPQIDSQSSARSASIAPPPTQLSNEETPVAQPAAARPAKTIQVPFQAATPVNPSATQLGFSGRSHEGRGSRSKGLVVVALVGVLIAAVAIGAWYFLRGRGNEVASPETPGPAETERDLSYMLTVQKMRGGRPYQEPFESSGQEIFENGWKFRMNINSPQTGYLYLLNEGPAEGRRNNLQHAFPSTIEQLRLALSRREPEN